MLTAATDAEARLIEAEHTAESRGLSPPAERRLHLVGGSLREIAEELGLSHERVHQIVKGAGGGRRWRKRNDDGKPLSCSFVVEPNARRDG